MFRIEMLPAREGDCLLITYGTAAQPRHVLVDGGRKATAKALKPRLKAIADAGGRLELLVVTHIDRDHIEGVLTLLEDGGLGVPVDDIWFNGYDHLLGPEVQPFGAAQGERLTLAFNKLGLPWNKHFGGGRICVTPAEMPEVTLYGGMKLTVLSPTPKQLADLRPDWIAECAKAGLAPGSGKPQGPKAPGLEIMGIPDLAKLVAEAFKEDGAHPNGSSIALLAEYDGVRVLLGADAYPTVLVDSLKRYGAGARVKLDAFKIPHHGSTHNLSADLIAQVDCDRWLVSTNGSYFEHPDQSALARIVKGAAGRRELCFNYRSGFTEVWDDDDLRRTHGFATTYPTTAAPGFLTVDLA